MSSEKKLDEKFGLDMSMEEALQRFTRVTRAVSEFFESLGIPILSPDSHMS